MSGSHNWLCPAIFVLLLATFCKCADSGPWVTTTKGELWPQVKNRIVFETFFKIDHSFRFELAQQLEDGHCQILQNATERYKQILNGELEVSKKIIGDPPKGRNLGFLQVLKISVNNESTCDEMPNLSMDEKYELKINNTEHGDANLMADSVWGVLRGLETFSQLVFPTGDESTLSVKSQHLIDKPHFKHRGLLLDTSRHYLPLGDILLTLDAMSYNKMNVFHWHIVDDNSFPYQSTAYPDLSGKGAYHSSMIYTKKNILDVINHARNRGIRVIVEFDTPGHVASWGLGYPDLLTPCYSSNGLQPNGKTGPINPTNPKVYDFLESLFEEATHLFPDDYFHLGGDEVPFDCWKSNPNITAFMEQKEITSYEQLEEMYIKKVINITNSLGKNPIVWQEVFYNGVEIPKNTIVHLWIGNFLYKLEEITNKGYRALLSTCWYLDHMSGGGDWEKFYKCDFSEFEGNKELFIGGEACMWGEFVDKNNVHARIWPRTSAVAERLWINNPEEMSNARERLEEHTCRMNRRGVPAQPPNGSGFCVL